MPNMADPIWTHAARSPQRPALRSPSTTWSYATLRDKVAAFAGYLRERGVHEGDRVLLVAPSVPEFAVAYYGAQAVGAIVVTLNTMSTPAEIEYVATDSGAGHLIAWHASATAAERSVTENGPHAHRASGGAAPRWTAITTAPSSTNDTGPASAIK